MDSYHFLIGVWITAIARNNLLKNLIKLDNFEIYADTDSLKLQEGFPIEVIEDYNKEVEEKIKKASEDLGIPIEKYAPKDCKGISRMLGVFDNDGYYKEFITQGAKKYAYKDSKDEIHITVAGVPKKGACALKSLEEFRDDFVFEHKDTGKNISLYNDDMEIFEMEDYQGNKQKLTNKFGITLLPTTYVLGKAFDYCELLSDTSPLRSIYKE